MKALIWDVDGTLAETERDGHRVAFNQAFAEAGLDWHWDVSEYGLLLAVAGGRERMLHYVRQRWPDVPLTDSLRARIAQVHQRKNRLYENLVEGGLIDLRPGVRRLLREAREAGLRQAIATTTSRRNVEVLLRACLGSEAEGLFEVMVCGEDVQAKKPDPEVYRLTLACLGLPAQQCVAFEDSAPGVAAATAAGIACVLTRSVYTDPLAMAGLSRSALAVIENLDWAGGDEAGPVTLDTVRGWYRRAREPTQSCWLPDLVGCSHNGVPRTS